MHTSPKPQLQATPAAYQALTAWYETPLGQHLLSEERRLVDQALQRRFGYQLLQLGCADLLLHEASPMGHKFSFCPYAGVSQRHPAVARGEAIPLANDSVDLVLLHHALDFSTHPHQLLREAARVLIAGGHLVIAGFNPLSAWGLRNRWHRGREGDSPWAAALLGPARVSDWLSLLDFQVESIHYGVHVPPVNAERAIRYSRWLETLANRFNWPTGALYLITACKRVLPLTPVQLQWRSPPLGLPLAEVNGCRGVAARERAANDRDLHEG
ncbi:MAG: methyltransferase domain-containing protein [Pseudomonadales bacterium]|jgi:SAM-dependent methyltransferase|nr:methyltransferase domain-containing protein [Pseudomonadales bacterium]